MWPLPPRCFDCGYDLRGAHQSRRCPECGFDYSMPHLLARAAGVPLDRSFWIALLVTAIVILIVASRFIRTEEFVCMSGCAFVVIVGAGGVFFVSRGIGQPWPLLLVIRDDGLYERRINAGGEWQRHRWLTIKRTVLFQQGKQYCLRIHLQTPGGEGLADLQFTLQASAAQARAFHSAIEANAGGPDRSHQTARTGSSGARPGE